MIRVLQVFHGMNCGGAENMIMNLYRKIDREKVQFDFLVHTDQKCFFDDEICKLGGNIYRVPYFNILNTGLYIKSINRFFVEHPEINIVHGHLGSCAHIYLNIAKKYGKFTIAHSHNAYPDAVTLKNVIYKLFTIKTRRVADFFIACSNKAGASRFGKKVLNKENYYLLNNAIDTVAYEFNSDIREKVRNEMSLSGKYVIGHIGGFRLQKNHSYLIDIFKCISEKRDDAVLLLVGGGGEEIQQEIKQKIEAFGLSDKVIFTGVRPNVNELLFAMDCFVFPSFYEGLPVTVIEAQTSGLKCYISDVITDEVCLTDLVEKLSIKESPSVWCSKILNSSEEYDRSNYRQKIIDSGYDISETTKWLTDFYLSNSNHAN